MKVKHFLSCVRLAAAKELRRRLTVLAVTAVAVGTVSAGLANNYDALVAQGYRWVTVNGPYGCPSKADLRQISQYGTEKTELEMVEQLRAYYLISGTMVQVIQEDTASGTAQVRVAGIVTDLWTFTKFLTKRPIKDPYGVIETPDTARFDADQPK
jgi:hypothetical protein